MDKAELRKAVIARRDALDLDVRAAKSAVICARLVELLDHLGTAAPHTVAVYKNNICLSFWLTDSVDDHICSDSQHKNRQNRLYSRIRVC